MSKEAFGDLLAPHLEAIRRFVRRRLRTEVYADDVVHRTLLLAYAHRNQCEVPRSSRVGSARLP
jgi:DNA-directed RNA polymerase specialized sigma24 family protein